ncbi:MAG: hypothetical protein D6705_13330 [Deltaproteobacteria bacterium]|nr:MAG: hypothetical protein D6705_13330 [Deltaproteobacteria bacterium]
MGDMASRSARPSAPPGPRARAPLGRTVRAARRAIVVGACLSALVPAEARAAPGMAERLGGAGPQGAGTPSFASLYHNPAQLAALGASGVAAAFRTGVVQHWIHRYDIEAATGAPTDQLGAKASSSDPLVGFFAAGVLYFDPVAVAVGIYDLGSTFQLQSSAPLRYHLAPPTDGGCLVAGDRKCPPTGGQVRYHQELAAALAWNFGSVQLGVGAHMPLVFERFAYDEDTSLGAASEQTATCAGREDPRCAERVGFKGWTRWIAPGDAENGFDVALSAGVSIRLPNRRGFVGLRYRSFPLRRGGDVVLSGVGLVCAPSKAPGEDAPLADLPACSDAEPVRAFVRQRLPQEIALGASVVLGRARLWQLDVQGYWHDRCVGGVRPSRCPDLGAQEIRITGLDTDAFVPSKFVRYRGAQDVFGLDVFATYRLRAQVAVSGGLHLASPPTRPSARSPADPDGWRAGLTLAIPVIAADRHVLVTPGYGFDLDLPSTVAPGEAAFDPTARAAFEASFGDLNEPGARAVLEGRGRPTNAGRYVGTRHLLSLTVRWTDRTVDR